MICKFCGSTLEDDELECPYCGHKTGVAPKAQDFFEDDAPVTSNARVERPAEDFEEDYEEEYEEPAKGKKKASLPKLSLPTVSSPKSIGNFPVVVISALCALFSLICLVSVSGAKKQLEEMEETVLTQLYQIQSNQSGISSGINALSGDVSSVSNSISESNNSKNITITQQPTSETTYLGRGGDEDVNQNVAIFRAAASGMIKSVDWQIKVGDDWVTLTWDESSNNTTYGLHVYTAIGSTEASTELCAHGVNQNAYATYRCVFTDSYGTKSTDPVTLTERAA